MTKIKSERVKEYIMSIVEPKPTPDGELVFYMEMTPMQVAESIIIAEQEAEERHANELQELRAKAVDRANITMDAMILDGYELEDSCVKYMKELIGELENFNEK